MVIITSKTILAKLFTLFMAYNDTFPLTLSLSPSFLSDIFFSFLLHLTLITSAAFIHLHQVERAQRGFLLAHI